MVLRYSFIIPYWKRYEAFRATLISYKHWYSDRDDIEIIVIEDGDNFKDEKEHQGLLALLEEYDKLNIRYIFISEENQHNPVIARNRACFNFAEGSIFIHTSPEVFHKTNILEGLDGEYNEDSHKYVVCACENSSCDNLKVDKYEDFIFKHMTWYQHSAYNNRRLHFCSAIPKELYMAIGGFDETYAKYCGYDDDDFRQKIITADIPIVLRDDLMVVHIDHGRAYHDPSMFPLGLSYFNNKWRV